MRTKHFLMTIVLMVSSPLALGETQSSYQKWRDALNAEVAQWSLANDSNIQKLQAALQTVYGFNVRCDGSRLFSTLSVTDCATGLARLDAALKNVKLTPGRDRLETITVHLGRPGLWQGITFATRDLRIPFNTPPEVMTRFINEQIHLVYETSLNELNGANKQMADQIKKKYFVGVKVSPDLDPFQTHDGLKKVDLAMAIAFNGQTPSREQFQKLGIDTVRLDTNPNRTLYENHGHLILPLDYQDQPGNMFFDIIKAVKNPQKGWLSTSNQWTWSDVVSFREDRERAGELKKKLAEALNLRKVECELNSDTSNSVNVHQCREALENIQKVLNEVKNDQYKPVADTIRICNLTMRTMALDKDTNTLDLAYDASPTYLVRALRHGAN